jgi:hypothetical protein
MEDRNLINDKDYIECEIVWQYSVRYVEENCVWKCNKAINMNGIH